MREGLDGVLVCFRYITVPSPFSGHAFCFDGLARGPLRAPRTPNAIPFSLQQPIPLYPLSPSPLPFAAILLLLPLYLLSYPCSQPLLLILPPLPFSYYTHPSFPFPLLLYYYYFPSPSESSTYDDLIR